VSASRKSINHLVAVSFTKRIARNHAWILALEREKGRPDEGDLLILSGALIAMGLVVWSFLGNPQTNIDNPLQIPGLTRSAPDLRLAG
jgi:hypothetical protein